MKKILAILMALPFAFSCADSGETADYTQISQLIISERMYRASHSQQHADCFWEDATIQTSWQSGGLETFVSQSPVEFRSDLPSANRCSSPLIHLSGDRAFVEYPSTTIRSVMIGEEEAVLTSYMRLLYKVEKRNGQWRILELVSLNERDDLSPAIPGTDLHIDRELARSLRPSYRWLAYSRIASGGTESDDLPGTDRPDDVARLYDRFNQWLVGIEQRDLSVLNPVSGNVLRGTVYVPAGSGRKPLIIASHELGSDGFRPWWVRYADHWVNEGYAVVTYDFAGGGQRSRSDGLTTDMSVLTEVSDLETVLSEALQWDFVDRSRVILVGGSQGGGVSTIVAARHPEEISSLVLLYPALHLPQDLQRRYPDPDSLPEQDDRGMITIGKRYIQDMYNYDYQADMRACRCPVLIVHGDRDQVVDLAGSQEAEKVFPDVRLHVISGAGHVFMTAAQQDEFLSVTDAFLGGK